jgi:hypothetical protein
MLIAVQHCGIFALDVNRSMDWENEFHRFTSYSRGLYITSAADRELLPHPLDGSGPSEGVIPSVVLSPPDKRPLKKGKIAGNLETVSGYLKSKSLAIPALDAFKQSSRGNADEYWIEGTNQFLLLGESHKYNQ